MFSSLLPDLQACVQVNRITLAELLKGCPRLTSS